MRDHAIGSVFGQMPVFSVLPIPLALWLAPAPELPRGGGAAFHARMMAWNAPKAPAPTPPIADKPVRTSLPRLSSGFGHRSDPLHGARAVHHGIDIPGATGTAVQASAAGIVRFAGRAGGYGNMVELDHGDGLRTRYAHLSRILVVPGLRVAQGERIALMGSTGRSTGSHLHFEVRSGGRPEDPLGYLGAQALAEPSAVPDGRLDRHISTFARARAAKRAVGAGP